MTEGAKKTSKKKSTVKSRTKVEKKILNEQQVLDILREIAYVKEDNKQSVEKKIRRVNKTLRESEIDADLVFDLISEKKKLQKNLQRLKKEELALKEASDEKEIIKDTDSEKPKIEEEVSEEKEVPKVEVSVEKKSSKGLIIFLIILALIIGIIFGVVYFKKNVKPEDNKIEEKVIDQESERKKEEQRLASLYSDCLAKEVNEKDRTEYIINAENELTEYLKKYKTSVGYRDINTGFEFNYNEKNVYYAASSIKVLSALYLFMEADKGNVDLDSTMKYTAKYKWPASLEMKNIKLGTEVKLRDLIKYSIEVSDNTAYQMLVSYIGKNKLKEFGKSLGATNTLIGGDNFGNINVLDGLVYWKTINDFINSSTLYGEEFKEYLMNADQNGLEIDDYGIKAAHKYGEYKPTYNDLGIVYDTNPYYVAILTREYGKDMIDIIKDINKHVYELHLKYYENRENVCHIEVYGN